jgi:hypothetical protein
MEKKMELESLELGNIEMEEHIKCLETRLNRQASLGSINSEDRRDLRKIRFLGSQRCRLKKSIRELEAREATIQEQFKRILEQCSQQNGSNNSKHHVHRSRKHKMSECVS